MFGGMNPELEIPIVYFNEIMEPSEILSLRFHLGGEFIRTGPNLDNVGGDEAMSEIERDKLSLQEVKVYLKDHTKPKAGIDETVFSDSCVYS